MLRRTGFKCKAYEPARSAPLRPLARPITRFRALPLVACPKENAIQHAGYMDLVRAMPCARCGHQPRSQFCHADESKGMGIKTDCRRGWPGCAACHFLVGSTGILGQAGRRLFEFDAGMRTRGIVIDSGRWPARLPLWEGT
jgi:hypothetical protein